MGRQRKDLFISEINLMIDYCFYSFNQFNEVLHRMDDEKDYDLDYFWYHAQTFITYAANLSKLLWATKNHNEKTNDFLNRKKFRDDLRKEVGVLESSILKDKKLRNRFEHIDEDIDFFKENIVISRSFGPSTQIISIDNQGYDLSKEKQFRHYNPYTTTLHLYGQAMNLQVLYDEIKLLSEKVTEYEKRENKMFHFSPRRSGLRSAVPTINQSTKQAESRRDSDET